MASRKATDIQNALLSKGFRYDNTHHRYLILHVGDVKTPIRTFISHSDPEYGDGLLSKVQKQLHLPSKQRLLELVDCPMTEAAYVELLREQGLI